MSLDQLTTESFLEILEKAKERNVDAIAVSVGEVNYPKIFAIEKEIAHAKMKDPELKDVILFMDHPPSIDFGRKPENNSFMHHELEGIDPYASPEEVKKILSKYGIGFNLSPRAGGPAYLGPGQLNVHLIANCNRVDIGQNGKGAPDGQHKLDLIMQKIAQRLGVSGVQVKDHLDDSDKRDVYLSPGTFVKSGRLGTKLGSKVAMFTSLDFNKNVIYNGFSFFLNKDSTKGFEFIPACGYSKEDLEVTSVEEVIGEAIDPEYARNVTLITISNILKYTRGIAFYNLKTKSVEDEILVTL